MKQGSKPGAFDPEAFVEEHEWIFAKTMPTIPHFYVVRDVGRVSADWWRRP